MSKKNFKGIIGIFFIAILILSLCAGDNLSSQEPSQEENLQQVEQVSPINEQLTNTNSEITPSQEETSNQNLIDNLSYNSQEETIIENSNEENISALITEPSENTENNHPNSGSEYINLDSVNAQIESVAESTSEQTASSNSQEIEVNISVEEKEKTNYVYYEAGKKEIELEAYEKIEITKEEKEKSDFEKEVIISSEIHFEDPLRVYSDLTQETEKENIEIFWKNEGNQEITGDSDFAVEYYDENNNGLIDRISWIVPHLSEQIFEIRINFEQNSDSGILLNVLNPPNGADVTNPVPFNVSLNFSGVPDCFLEINETKYPFNVTNSFLLNLQNGVYFWKVNCSQFDDKTISRETEIRTFRVNEAFSSNLQEGKVYLLDLVNNQIKNPETIKINSTNPSNLNIKILRETGIISNESFSTSANILMDRSRLNLSGRYTLNTEFNKPSAKVFNITNFSVASANLTFNVSSSTIKEGESVSINVNIISPVKTLLPSNLFYGDGQSIALPYGWVTQFNQNYVHKYDNSGTYNVNLTFLIDNQQFFIQKTINVIDSTDNSAPEITLIKPSHKKIIYDSAINFSYSAKDDKKLQNCTFKLYKGCESLSICSTSSSDLEYSTTKQTPANDEEIKIGLKDFDEGIYEWLVECYDNSSNSEWQINLFQVSFNSTDSVSSKSNNYTQKNEVEALKKQVDNFIATDFSMDEKEALEDLKILEDAKFYRKRLTDIGDFLGENYKYVATEELRQKKTTEYLEELEQIKNKVPISISVNEKYEYVKNSVGIDFEAIVQDYFDSTNTAIGRPTLQKLAKINQEIQNELTVSAKIKDIELEYANGTQRLTLVKKSFTLANDSYNKFLEVIPKDIASNSDEVIFITDSYVVKKDPIFEVDYEDLEKDEIVYYINKQIKLKNFEKTETLLFEEDAGKTAAFTGLFVLDVSSNFSGIYIVLIFILLIAVAFASIFLYKKFRMIAWKKEPNVVRVLHLLEDIKRLLAEKEIEKARENYYKIKEIYPVLPYQTKKYFYDKINDILVKIDRKDIFNLVKEYQEAKSTWNKEAYIRLYKDIRKIYERLPEKDREKVYNIINGY